MANPIKQSADNTILTNMLGLGQKAKEADHSVQSFNDVYISSEFKARKRMNEDEYKRRRIKNKAAKKARRKNR